MTFFLEQYNLDQIVTEKIKLITSVPLALPVVHIVSHISLQFCMKFALATEKT